MVTRLFLGHSDRVNIIFCRIAAIKIANSNENVRQQSRGNTDSKYSKTIHCSDRYAIIKVGNSLFVNVYLPCVGTTDRQLICDDVLAEIDCSVVMAGDFNANLDSTDSVVDNICAFTNSHNLLQRDDLFPLRSILPMLMNL